jgi:hypothetical protein
VSNDRLVKLAEMWQRRSAKGTVYFSGFLGQCSLVMFDGGRQPHPTRPEETVHVWRLFIQERDPDRRPKPKAAPMITAYREDDDVDTL